MTTSHPIADRESERAPRALLSIPSTADAVPTLIAGMAYARLSLLTALLAVGCGDNQSDEYPVDAAVEADAQLDAPSLAPETTMTVRPPALTNQPSRFEFTSSIAGSTFRCSLDSATDTPCDSPFEPTVADGDHTLEVYAVSPEGVRDTTPAHATWIVDTTAPTTTLVIAPNALDNSVRAIFQFSSEPAVTFACSIDGATFATCESPLQTAVLLDGAHTFEVRATDAAGNVETPARHHAWTLDSSTPDTVIDSGPSTPTTATEASFTFSSLDAGLGASFTCARDNVAAVPCVSPWIVDGLADGTHTVRITVRDAAGNVDPSPATRSWRVDTTPPNARIISGPSGPTREKKPFFIFDATDNMNPVTTECRISGVTEFVPCNNHYTAPTLPDGDAVFVVRARDEVGLETTVERAITVDTVAPVIAFTEEPDDIITTSDASFAFMVTGAATIECAFDTGAYAPCIDSFTTAVVADGRHRLQVRARDAALNETIRESEFRRDTEAPVVTISGPRSTGNPAPHFSIQVTDSGSRTTRTCQLDALPAVSPCHSFMTPTLPDGDHTLTVTAVDEAGHVGSATWAFNIDTRRPNLTFTSYPSSPSGPRPTVAFTSVGGAEVQRCRVDNEPFEDCVSPWTVPTALTDGPHNISVFIANGNATWSTYTGATFTVDASLP